MRLLTLIILLLSCMYYANAQTYIDQIRVGEDIPEIIDIGGFKEDSTKNCICRIFSIKHNINTWEIGSGGAVLAETIGIHFNEDNIVTGVIKIILRLNNEDAQKVYNSRLSDYMRTQTYFEDRELVTVRDSDNGVIDGIYYFTYSDYFGKEYTSIGVIGNTIIEETYIPNSNYEPSFKN